MTQTTSGCEPTVFIESVRKRKIQHDEKFARVDGVDALGDSWQHYNVFHYGVKKWMLVTGKDDVSQSPYAGSTVEEIDWKKKVEIQAAAQRWICHSISNTTNLPNDVSTEVVDELCMRAWETGCKGITIYRIGSRSGVIVKNDDRGMPGEIVETHAPKRPEKLQCDIHRVSVKGQSYLVIVGLLNNKPYEIFCGFSEQIEVPKRVKNGTLFKNGKVEGVSTYNLHIPLGDDDELVFKNIVDLFDNPLYGSITRTMSLALRHGVPVQYLAEQLRKDKHSDITSFSSVIARVLSKHYILDGTKALIDKVCDQCGSTTLTYQQGCVQCVGCGASKCG
jgi:ribonucleoside-diphosphate reductase alpha chain